MEAWFAVQQRILLDRRQHCLAEVLINHNRVAIHSVLLSHRRRLGGINLSIRLQMIHDAGGGEDSALLILVQLGDPK